MSELLRFLFLHGAVPTDPDALAALVWMRFLIRCAILIGIVRFVWAIIPPRWKQPIQLPPAEQKRARLIHARIGYAFVAFLLLIGLAQLLSG